MGESSQHISEERLRELVGLLSDPNSRHATIAETQLIQAGDTAVPVLFQELTGDANPFVKSKIVIILHRIKTSSVIFGFVEALKTAEPSNRASLLSSALLMDERCLADAGTPREWREIYINDGNGNEHIKRFAAHVLAMKVRKKGDSEALSILFKLMLPPESAYIPWREFGKMLESIRVTVRAISLELCISPDSPETARVSARRLDNGQVECSIQKGRSTS